MRCLSCGALTADEVNMSANISETFEGTDGPDYTGDTEYGDPGVILGTWCHECQSYTFTADYVERVLAWLPRPDAVVPAPVTVGEA